MNGWIWTWLTLSVILMCAALFFALIAVNDFRGKEAAKDDRVIVRWLTLTTLFGWLWPIAAGFFLVKFLFWGGKESAGFAIDWYRLAFGRTPEEIVTTAVDKAADADRSRKAQQEREARKEERRRQLNATR